MLVALLSATKESSKSKEAAKQAAFMRLIQAGRLMEEALTLANTHVQTLDTSPTAHIGHTPLISPLLRATEPQHLAKHTQNVGLALDMALMPCASKQKLCLWSLPSNIKISQELGVYQSCLFQKHNRPNSSKTREVRQLLYIAPSSQRWRHEETKKELTKM